jgi:G3E family GTPase
MNASDMSTQGKPLPIILVTGFLGAGKTTLMRRLILDAARRGLTASVVVNEFGVADVDGHILSEAGAELLSSVAGGCACCTGQEEFLWTMLQLAERRENRPDVVLVEASGLADPLLMLDCLSVAHLLPRLRPAALVTVVDQSRFHLMRDEVTPLLIRQLKLADFVVLNKIDISFLPRKERTPPAELAMQLREISPRATIIPARACEFPLDELWCHSLNACFHPAIEYSQENAEDAGHAHYHTVNVPMMQAVEKSWLEERLNALDKEVWRAKGFVYLKNNAESELHLLQYTGGGEPQYRIEPFPLSAALAKTVAPTASLVFIGPELNAAQLQKEFSSPQSVALPMLKQ